MKKQKKLIKEFNKIHKKWKLFSPNGEKNPKYEEY